MNSSGSGSEGHTDSRSGKRPEQSTPQSPPPAPDPAMLEQVLKRTLDQSISSLDAAEREALLAVVRRYRNDSFELDPIGVDLVEVMLSNEFKQSVRSAESWRRMCYEVARTLFEDPVARPRIQAIWTALCSLEQ